MILMEAEYCFVCKSHTVNGKDWPKLVNEFDTICKKRKLKVNMNKSRKKAFENKM